MKDVIKQTKSLEEVIEAGKANLQVNKKNKLTEIIIINIPRRLNMKKKSFVT